MIIGIPKEIKNNENRVGITPAAVTLFKINGHEIWVEAGAGLGSGFSAVMLAFYMGAAAGLSILIVQKWKELRTIHAFRSLHRTERNLTMKSEIPFGPFLVLGTFLAFFFSINFFSFYASIL